MAVEEALEIVLKDEVFYEISGGGVTIGGGEPTFQPKFVSELLQGCKDNGVHTAMETCGQTPWKTLNRILKNTDLLLLDIKHMDSVRHREKTGIGNEKILENARLAADCVKEMIVRLPLVPGFNDDAHDLDDLGRFIRDQLPRVHRVDILPYHSMGESKSTRLGREYPMRTTEPLSKEGIQLAKTILESYGLEIRIGG
jgi:pyruvate formate lyase activating enzyme